jgi:hypothetical protein
MKKVETTTQVKEVKTLGRKINPNSARQIRLAELEMKRQNGEVKRGRPIDNTSARQFKLQMKEIGLTLGQGRPINPNSARQIRLAELKAKAELNGGAVKRGRPAKVVVTDEVAA